MRKYSLSGISSSFRLGQRLRDIWSFAILSHWVWIVTRCWPRGRTRVTGPASSMALSTPSTDTLTGFRSSTAQRPRLAPVGNLDIAALPIPGRMQVAVEVQHPRARSRPRRGLDGMRARPAAKPPRSARRATRRRPPAPGRSTAPRPRTATPPPASPPILSTRLTTAAAAGSNGNIGGGNGVLEVQRHARERRRRQVHQLEQLGPGLLLGRIDVLISLDDVDVDGQSVPPRRQRRIPPRDLPVALRPQVPHRRRILHQEREGTPFQQRQHARGIRPDGVPHAGIEPVIHVGEHHIQVGLLVAAGAPFRRATPPASGGQAPPESPGTHAATRHPCGSRTPPGGRSRAPGGTAPARRRSWA